MLRLPRARIDAKALKPFFVSRDSASMKIADRTVRELRALAVVQRTARKEAEASQARKARAAAEQKRQRRLDRLGRDVPAAWTKLEALVAKRAYDDAVTLAIDLRDLALREGNSRDFDERFEALRQRQLRRRGFFDRWKKQ